MDRAGSLLSSSFSPILKDLLLLLILSFEFYQLGQRRMNSVFENFFGQSSSDLWGDAAGEFLPRVDVSETGKEVRITAEPPQTPGTLGTTAQNIAQRITQNNSQSDSGTLSPARPKIVT